MLGDLLVIKTVWIQGKRGCRGAIALLLITGSLLFIQAFIISPIAQAETWVMVAKSDATLEQQYVDVDSIQSQGSTVQLKTYWGFLDQPDSISYATTEYRCETEEYRDVVVNGQETDVNWQAVGTDPLNRAAMTYGCTHAN
ncbi:MAG: hypothetical protein VKL39_15315 [Leptolyngbyaceae bacterium]|nr:hypothetical protein [Leptolyngbyaceae bacterium]